MTAWFSDAELAAIEEYAGTARLALAAYVAEASLRPSAWQVGTAPSGPEPAAAVAPVVDGAPGEVEVRRLLLLELLGMHRQLRGACTNLNQAVAKLHSLGTPVGELPAVAAYVRRVTTAVDELVAGLRIRR